MVDGESPYTVTSFQLRNVAKKFYLIPGAAIAASDVEDKELITENLGEVYTYIIPENQQGVDTSIGNAKDKKTTKPATFVEIKGKYEDKTIAMGFESSYKMYLGENNTNDFNVLRNKLYTFIGNLRMEDGADNRVDTDQIAAPYTQTESNCYMLAPNAEHALAIPVSRVNTFWSKTDSRYVINDGINDSRITKWVVKVIWQDTEGEVIKLSSAEGTLASDTFIVAPTGKEGNVVVGIYDATKGSDINIAEAQPLWSWHIWVTPYTPGDKQWVPMPAYVANNVIDKDVTSAYPKRAAYNVPGGKIFQMNNCMQTLTTNAQVDMAMMDRNIGALSSSKTEFAKSVGFYYQWGRKDPFYAPGGVVTGIDFTTTTAQDVSFTVLNPTKYIMSTSNWCTTLDAKAWNASGSTYAPTKSLTDPCPAGWMAPYYNVYTSLTVGGAYNVGASSEGSRPYFTRAKALAGTTAAAVAAEFSKGYLFWPSDMQAWFPAGGRINASKLFEYGEVGRLWSNYTTSNKGSVYKYQAYDASEDEENMHHFGLCVNEGMGSNMGTNQGINVRCIMEK